jgi:hypothetical protein
MNKFMNARRHRRQLLATVSVAALFGSICGADASDADRPPLWIELGWQYAHIGGRQELFAPPFVNAVTQAGFASPLNVQNVLGYSYGGEGKISFEPQGSDWVFAASVRYGRAHGHKSIHTQNPEVPVAVHLGAGHGTITPTIVDLSNSQASNRETYAIADFQAGKDVGLGMFGRASQLSFGIRYAQFHTAANSEMNAIPDFYFPTNLKYAGHHHIYKAEAGNTRSFNGLGPSVAWAASLPMAGNLEDGEVAFDWGANAALLFGRQKTRTHHHTTGDYYRAQLFNKYHTHYQNSPAPQSRSRNVTVPNVGGFAGLSLQWTNAKLSLGYRADYFFGALDGGIDTRKSTDRSFIGPFASISVGMGD